MAHVWLGLALGMAPAAAWVALRAQLSIEPVILGMAVCFWVSGFDILYACQDFEFDKSVGLHSIPSRFGVAKSLQIAAALHMIMSLMLLTLGLLMPMGKVYFFGVATVAGLLIYEHRLVSPKDLSKVNVAFFQVNIFISLGMLVITLIDLYV